MSEFGAKTTSDFQRGSPQNGQHSPLVEETYASLNFKVSEGSPMLFISVDKQKNTLTIDEKALGVLIFLQDHFEL